MTVQSIATVLIALVVVGLLMARQLRWRAFDPARVLRMPIVLGAIGLVLTPMYAGAVPTPVGALLSIAGVPWLVLRTGELDARPAVAGAPLIAWLLAVGVLGVGGPGGDVLLPATWSRESGTAVLIARGDDVRLEFAPPTGTGSTAC